MAAAQCHGCKAAIRWIRTTKGAPMPCDPERLQEWITDEERPGARKITLVSPEGYTITGWQASVITPGSRSVEGFITHFSTCPKAAEFRRKEPTNG